MPTRTFLILRSFYVLAGKHLSGAGSVTDPRLSAIRNGGACKVKSFSSVWDAVVINHSRLRHYTQFLCFLPFCAARFKPLSTIRSTTLGPPQARRLKSVA